MSMQVITVTDKAARDKMFNELRMDGNEQEQQAVKFSSTEKGEDGVYRSTWSIAYPTA